MLTPIRY